ncbi:hypothetical protein E5676_scaffold790G00140 [Cucumis melo var. makuwa]|uniref:Uncharacterized protein n=1 Tax=Cucumis melo var. makuwa TaxID=1194695 RepID=A0A5D3CUQ9_CUCMM|nr:hypothetical protein E5676_scaffold790G00140 [Cucumis melo var. makuwa]
MGTTKEENQCPTSTYTRTSAFKRLSISTSKKHRSLTSAFDRLKMTNDQQQREMKTLKAKPFHEENDDDKIHSRVPSRMKMKLSVDINTEALRGRQRCSSTIASPRRRRWYNFASTPPKDKEGGSDGKSPHPPIEVGSLTAISPFQRTKVPDRSYQGVDLTAKA